MVLKITTFNQRILNETGSKLTGLTQKTLQVNVGNRCNQLCVHCHLQAQPTSSDIMDWKLMEHIVNVAEDIHPELVDITGGAPELNPSLPRFLHSLSERDYMFRFEQTLPSSWIQRYKHKWSCIVIFRFD